MKNFNLLFLAFVIIMLAACKKKKSDPAPQAESNLTINNANAVSLNHLYFNSYAYINKPKKVSEGTEDVSMVKYDLYFASDGITIETITSGNYSYNNFIGTGKLFYFRIDVPATDTDALPEGTFSASEIGSAAFYDMTNGSWDEIESDLSPKGSIEIKKSGNTYTIHFTFEKGENTYRGQYNGSITKANFAS